MSRTGSENGAFTQSENLVFAASRSTEPPVGAALVYHSQFHDRQRYTFWRLYPEGETPPVNEDFWGSRNADYNFASGDGSQVWYLQDNEANTLNRIAALQAQGFVFQEYPNWDAFYATAPWGAADPRTYPERRAALRSEPGAPYQSNDAYLCHPWTESLPLGSGSEEGTSPRWGQGTNANQSVERYATLGFGPSGTPGQDLPNTRFWEDSADAGGNTRIWKCQANYPTQQEYAPFLLELFPPASSITLTDDSVVDVSTGYIRRQAGAASSDGPAYENPTGWVDRKPGDDRDEVFDWWRVNHAGATPARYVDLGGGWYWTFTEDSIDGLHDFYIPISYTIPDPSPLLFSSR